MKKRVHLKLYATLVILLLFGTVANAGGGAAYEGFKKCGGCHKSQRLSWEKTKHAKAMDSLKPNMKVEEKKKAGLDPEKDYTQDEKCVACHTTGYGGKKGYKLGLSKSKAKYLLGVGCESCHGAGAVYRKEHRKAGNKFKKKNKSTPRKKLVKQGENYDYEEACNRCHLNYKGSPWKEAKEPYTPFTPEVDPQYAFDFDKAVRETKAMHEHFKLKGVFSGDPVPPMRAEFQKDAKEPVPAKKK